MRSSHKALLLISSGIDSPVAGYIALNKRIGVDAIHFSNCKNEGNCSEKIKKLIKRLNQFSNKKIKLSSVEHFTSQEKFKETCNNKYQCVFCKRMMVRVASAYGKDKGYDFLIMGDNLAQAASQTLENLAVVNKTSSIPILRPLLTHDKNDIIKIAREIGTFEISKEKERKCPFLPTSPVTKSKDYQIEKEEARIDIGLLIDKSRNSIRTREY